MDFEAPSLKRFSIFQITFFFASKEGLFIVFGKGYHLSACYEPDILLGALDTINP